MGIFKILLSIASISFVRYLHSQGLWGNSRPFRIRKKVRLYSPLNERESSLMHLHWSLLFTRYESNKRLIVVGAFPPKFSGALAAKPLIVPQKMLLNINELSYRKQIANPRQHENGRDVARNCS